MCICLLLRKGTHGLCCKVGLMHAGHGVLHHVFALVLLSQPISVSSSKRNSKGSRHLFLYWSGLMIVNSP